MLLGFINGGGKKVRKHLKINKYFLKKPKIPTNHLGKGKHFEVTEETLLSWVAEPFGHKWSSKIYRKFLWFELTTMTSEALNYDVINFCQRVLCKVL